MITIEAETTRGSMYIMSPEAATCVDPQKWGFSDCASLSSAGVGIGRNPPSGTYEPAIAVYFRAPATTIRTLLESEINVNTSCDFH